MNSTQTENLWSGTEKSLRERMRSARTQNEEVVVATVAAVEGTAYRRPGAKMLVSPDGSATGAVTAGCLEDPVINLASEVLEDDRPRTTVFDLMDDDDETWGLGLGCNGVIDVFLEPLDGSWDASLETLSKKTPQTVVTVIESEAPAIPVGSRTVVDEDRKRHAVPDRQQVSDSIVDKIEAAIDEIHNTGRARTVSVDTGRGVVRVMIDGVKPVSELILFGNQNDISPVVRIANQTGFEVVVYSAREIEPSAFPNADHVRTGHPTDITDAVTSAESSYVVLMSHNLIDDQLALETLLEETAVPYVGVMGPRKRFEEIQEATERTSEADLRRIATPVGLDLGGGAPVEIALSIISEVVAVSNGCEGGRLTDKKGPIHPRV